MVLRYLGALVMLSTLPYLKREYFRSPFRLYEIGALHQTSNNLDGKKLILPRLSQC